MLWAPLKHLPRRRPRTLKRLNSGRFEFCLMIPTVCEGAMLYRGSYQSTSFGGVEIFCDLLFTFRQAGIARTLAASSYILERFGRCRVP